MIQAINGRILMNPIFGNSKKSLNLKNGMMDPPQDFRQEFQSFCKIFREEEKRKRGY